MTLDRAGAEAALGKLGERLGLDAATSAVGIATIADGAMSPRCGRCRSIAASIRADTAKVMAFGGAGPLHAVAIAREISIPTVIVPRLPEISPALGMLMADWRQDFVRTLIGELRSCGPADAAQAFADLREAGDMALRRDGLVCRNASIFPPTRAIARREEHTISDSWPQPWTISSSNNAETRQRFDAQHDRRHGQRGARPPDRDRQSAPGGDGAAATTPSGAGSAAPWRPERASAGRTLPRRSSTTIRREPVEASILWRPGLCVRHRRSKVPP